MYIQRTDFYHYWQYENKAITIRSDVLTSRSDRSTLMAIKHQIPGILTKLDIGLGTRPALQPLSSGRNEHVTLLLCVHHHCAGFRIFDGLDGTQTASVVIPLYMEDISLIPRGHGWNGMECKNARAISVTRRTNVRHTIIGRLFFPPEKISGPCCMRM